jgi:DNA-binding XRE family transcriptional regulator
MQLSLGGTDMTFAEYVRKVRRGLEMNHQEIARELNVAFTTINRWEKKHVVPSNLAKKSFVDFCKTRGIEIPPEILDGDGKE